MSGPARGEVAPDFSLPWTREGELRLSDRRGEWVVLAFYPGDFTAVCTKQFCNYRDGREDVEALDAAVIGISPQDVDSHERFTAEHGLTVPLAADVDKAVARAYGVLGPSGFVRRAIFVIDPKGTVRFRKVALLGLTYADTDELSGALREARAAA